MFNRKSLFLFTAVMLILPIGPAILGCNIPVFRYALERWEPSPYLLEVYHEEPLAPGEEQLLSELREKSTMEGGQLNIQVNLSSTEAEHFDSQIVPALPAMVLFFPDDSSRLNPIWSGSLDQENIDRLYDSPARRRIREALQQGRTSLFLILSSSRGEADLEKLETTKAILEQAEEDVYITAPGTDIDGNPIRNPDFSHSELSFGAIFINRMDPEEEILARILLGTEKDLWDYDVPIAFPLFGRGRVLYALVDEGINRSMVYQACNAVTGWCSCIVKDDNPGTDPLIAADWTSGLGDSWIEPEELPQLSGIASFGGLEQDPDEQVPEFFRKEAATQEPALPSHSAEGERPGPGSYGLLLAAAVLLSVVIVSWVIFKRKKGMDS